ncbi:uncharacterized protein LOC117176552 [Belonocnema kinseyi]|uniref:uncharacterized protein LOC117176552 n=1 Tax=Belonocnema kinseyi TaxID=2817044 RepID=UPI00143D9AEE|nr:uncharacterized protein LOC117176552 [Belonocnema kinseyi]
MSTSDPKDALLDPAISQIEELKPQIAGLQNDHVQNPRIDSYRVPKLPDFFRKDPALWFIHIESTFRNARITNDATKVDYIIPALGFEIIVCIKDLITATPKPPDYYEKVKERVISTYSCSSESRLRQLLKGEVLTDGKPSLILCRLRNLNDGTCSETVIRYIFLEQLPSQPRAILAATKIDDLQELAELVDKIVEVSNINHSYVAAVSTGISGSSSQFKSDLDKLETKIDRLASQIKLLSSGKTRSRSGSNSRANSNESKTKSKLCWLHKKYGDKAHSCENPCSWQSGTKPEN